MIMNRGNEIMGSEKKSDIVVGKPPLHAPRGESAFPYPRARGLADWGVCSKCGGPCGANPKDFGSRCKKCGHCSVEDKV